MGFTIEIKEEGEGATGKITFNDKRYVIFQVEDRYDLSVTIFNIIKKVYRKQGKIEQLSRLKLHGFDYRNFLT
jgi:hypothetical protein